MGFRNRLVAFAGKGRRLLAHVYGFSFLCARSRSAGVEEWTFVDLRGWNLTVFVGGFSRSPADGLLRHQVQRFLSTRINEWHSTG